MEGTENESEIGEEPTVGPELKRPKLDLPKPKEKELNL